MSKTKQLVNVATGAALSAALLATGTAHAAASPFAMNTMEKGYMVADAGSKMKNGNCGGNMDKDGAGAKMKDGKCGANMEKDAADKPKGKSKMKEGKCGEGKCGANMKKG